ncbi:MAG: type VI secretion system baseplate subunit TssK [Hafnia sp.]
MLTRNRIVWSEGLFIKPQHFQQQQRHIDYLLQSRFAALGEHFFGVTELKINDDHLSFGRITLSGASGIMPDGSVFSLPYEDVMPQPLEISDASFVGQKVYLAQALANDHVTEINFHDQSGPNRSRFQSYKEDVRDLYSTSADITELPLAKVNLRLMLEHEDRSTYAALPIARIADKRPVGSILLDHEFIPSCLSISSTPRLKSFLSEISGLVNERAKNLAERIGSPNQQGVADVAEFMLLQMLNRVQPQLQHLTHRATLHPEPLFHELIGLCGEIMTFTDASRLPIDTPVYRHDDLQHSFAPLMLALRQALSTVLSPRAVSLQLREQRFGVFVAVVGQVELLQEAEFVLAIRANMPLEVLSKQFIQQSKVATPEKIMQLVGSHTQGIPLRLLTSTPRQLPYHSGYLYFSLDRQSPHWPELAKNSGFAFHIGGKFPNLDMQFWAIRR